MDLNRLTKTELLKKCTEHGFVNCKSKNKADFIQLITSTTKPQTEVIHVGLSNDPIYKFINKIINEDSEKALQKIPSNTID